MLDETYPAFYRDEFGEIATTIHNDGKHLSITLRGITFTGQNPEDWSPPAKVDPVLAEQFRLYPGSDVISFYTLDFSLPVPVLFHGEKASGTLHVHFVANKVEPQATNLFGRNMLTLTLEIADLSFSSQPSPGYHFSIFEEALENIAKQFPEDLSMQTCFFCVFSDPDPHTMGMFGEYRCFRDAEPSVQSVIRLRKKNFFKDPTEIVQETYSCRRFCQRKL